MSEQPSDDTAASQPPSESQLPVSDELAFPDIKPGDAWGESITKRRADELEAILHSWETEQEHGERKGPFDGVELAGADVFWLAARALAGVGDEQAIIARVDELLHDGPDLFDLHLEGADLAWAHLEGAHLKSAHLEGAGLIGAHLEDATLHGAYLEDANLSGGAHLERANLTEAHLDDAICIGPIHMEGAIFAAAHLDGAVLYEAHLEGASFWLADLQQANLSRAYLEGANLRDAHLERAFLDEVNLAGAILNGAHLEGANLRAAHLEGRRLSAEDVARLRQAQGRRAGLHFTHFTEFLPPADLRLAFLDHDTTLNGTTLGNAEYGYVAVADVRWRDVNLAVVNWTRTTHITRGFLRLRERVEAIELGDEAEARSVTDYKGALKNKVRRLQDYKDAVRANRQLATALRQQGLNEDADRFTYRAQVLQREVLRRQRNIGSHLFSLLLAALAGYGYRLRRIFVVYGLTVLLFAAGYFLAGGVTAQAHLSLQQQALDALQVSLNAIHGRVFFTQLGLDTLQSWLATLESIVGIVIEGVFVAMLIQRFFAR